MPKSIVNQLKLKEGDTLDWQLTVLNGKMVLIVEKQKDSINGSRTTTTIATIMTTS